MEKAHELDAETAAALGAAVSKVAAQVVKATGTDQVIIRMHTLTHGTVLGHIGRRCAMCE